MENLSNKKFGKFEKPKMRKIQRIKHLEERN